jgi:ribulose-phosphate 3-epimerase
MMAKIAPSILSADFAHLASEIKDVESADVDYLHLDVMDGHFVPNITFGPALVESVKKASKLPLDVHLMVQHPDAFIKSFAHAGADMISVHVEADHNMQQTLQSIRSFGKQAGIVLNPDTAIERIYPYLSEVDYILFMTVFPGFGGQSFIPTVLPKMELMKNKIVQEGLSIQIEVDGGIDATTAISCKNVGVDIFVAGSYIFHSKNRIAAVQQLRNAVEGLL